MVGILLSYWEGLFSGAMLVSERVILHLFLPASICFFWGWRFGLKHILKAAILTVISFSSHCLRALAAWMSLWLMVCQICRPHALPWHQNELWKFQATSWTSVTCLPLLVVNLGRWRKHAAIFDASVGFLRWDGCRAWGTKKPSSCNDFWKLTILSVLGRYFACLEPRVRFFFFWEPNFECIQLPTKTPTSDHALTWVCSSANDFTCMVVKAMTQMLGLICVVQYTFAATALEILGRQNAPGFVDPSDMDLVIAGSWEMVPIWLPFVDIVTQPMVPGHLSWCSNVTSSNSSQCRWDHHG